METRRIVDPGDYKIFYSSERPHVSCTPDRLIMEGEQIVAPLELKTAHYSAAKVWDKEVPMSYLCQMQVQMYVLECNYAFVAALLEGRAFRWHRVQRHQKFIDRLLKRIDNFWLEHVVKRVPPPTDYHAATTAALARKYPASNGKAIELPLELEPLIDEYDTLTKTEGGAKKRKSEIANLIKSHIGANEAGYFLNGQEFRWRGENGSRRFTKGKHYENTHA